jgi:hypothetical protein
MMDWLLKVSSPKGGWEGLIISQHKSIIPQEEDLHSDSVSVSIN